MLRNFKTFRKFDQNLGRRFVQTVTKQYSSFEEEWRNAKPYESIPRDSKISLMRAFLPGGKFYNLSILEMHRKIRSEYGNLYYMPGILGRDPILLSFDPNDCEKVFRNEGPWPDRRGLEGLSYYRKTIRPEIYAEFGGLFTESGEPWQKMRSISNPVLMQPRAAKLYVSAIDDIAKEFIKIIKDIRDENKEVPANFSDYINKWSLESIAFIALDRRLGLLSDNVDKKSELLITYIRNFFDMAFQFEMLPSIWKYYQTKAFKAYMKNFDNLTDIILGYVEETVKMLDTKEIKEDHELSVLEKLLKINKKVAVIMTADMILAGVDTTASAATGILYCLAKNPDKQELLRKEIMNILPEKDSPLTTEKLKNLPYLRAVIKEGLRLYPVTAGNARKTANDVVLNGYQVPKGVDVAMGLTVLQQDEEHYPDSSKFLPERWLREEENRSSCPYAKDAHAFTYLPFGFGKRMCIGRRFAEMEIEVLISRIIRQCRVEWHHEDMKIKSILVNVPDGPLKFRLIDI